MTAKKRLDLLLADNGYYASREKARAAVMAREVKVNGSVATKPGQLIEEADPVIEIKQKMPYVSRGGFKLARALHAFNICLKNRTMLDVGASTGGFTDCALQHGAAKVYAVDVGYGQIAWLLRNDPRVIIVERTNIRHMEPSVFTAGMPDFVAIDVSFISLALVLPKVNDLFDDYEGVALVKPQFEAGRELVGKKGVVRDAAAHKQALLKSTGAVLDCGAEVLGLDHSPIKGPRGNIEYLMHFRKPGGTGPIDAATIDMVVEKAHRIKEWPQTTGAGQWENAIEGELSKTKPVL